MGFEKRVGLARKGRRRHRHGHVERRREAREVGHGTWNLFLLLPHSNQIASGFWLIDRILKTPGTHHTQYYFVFCARQPLSREGHVWSPVPVMAMWRWWCDNETWITTGDDLRFLMKTTGDRQTPRCSSFFSGVPSN
nr:hypothetical protein Iba_scaffold7472CG0030 [Ipomoea batatas]